MLLGGSLTHYPHIPTAVIPTPLRRSCSRCVSEICTANHHSSLLRAGSAMSVLTMTYRSWDVDIDIGSYRTKEPSASFMVKVVREYEAGDILGRSEVLMRFAGYWPRVLVSLGDHINAEKIKNKHRFMATLKTSARQRVRLEGPLAKPVSGTPDVIPLHDLDKEEDSESEDEGLDPEEQEEQ